MYLLYENICSAKYILLQNKYFISHRMTFAGDYKNLLYVYKKEIHIK